MFFPEIKNRPHKVNHGFTLVETLVAISILLVAVVAPLALITSNISSVFGVKDKIIALYLAEDAIDFVKYRLATNLNKQAQNGTYFPGWYAGKSGDSSVSMENTCSLTTACIVDSFNDVMTSCTDLECSSFPIQIDPTTGAYGYSPGWATTKFMRAVIFGSDSGIVPIFSGAWPNSPDPVATHEGVEIKVTVSWIEKGITKEVKLSDHAFYWNGHLPYEGSIVEWP